MIAQDIYPNMQKNAKMNQAKYRTTTFANTKQTKDIKTQEKKTTKEKLI